MLMNMKRIIAIMMTLCLVMFFSAMAEADDPVVVRVGVVTFTKSQLQSAIQTDVSLTELLAQEYLTDEEMLSQRNDTINRFIGVGLIEMKLIEAGLNDFTEDEEESFKAAARNQYDQLWQSLYQRIRQEEPEVTETEITGFMNEYGYTTEAIYNELKASERRYRAVQLYCPSLTLTEDMVREYYQTQFLDPDRERYENDLDLYEREILASRNESFYTPEGYRAIKQILLDYPEAVAKGLKNETAHVNQAAQAVAAALQSLTAVVTTTDDWEELNEPRATYDAALTELTAAQASYTEKREKLAKPLIQNTVDEITAAFEAGIDFDSLIKKYSKDTSEQNLDKGGYPVHPDSPNWPEDFLLTAAALKKPGDISKPILTDLGIHILYYASDIPSGEHELTAEEQETLKASALYYYQNQELEKMIAEWRSEYEIEIHPDLLDD